MLGPRLRACLAAAGLLAGGASAAAGPGPAREVAAPGGRAGVGTYDNQFTPRGVVVPLGGGVVGTASGGPHNVGVAGQLWSSALLAPPAGFERVFDQPGQYRYTCTLHAGMNGTVIVLGAGGGMPAPAPAVARSASPPSLRIVEPADGAALTADEARVRVQVENFELDTRGIGAAATSGGHWHLLVDGARLQLLVGEDAMLPPLGPGRHTLE